MEGRQFRLLLHALPARQRASPRGRQLLPAGLLSQTRHRAPRKTPTSSARISPASPRFSFSTSDDGRWLLAAVANGDGGQFAHYRHGFRRQVDPDQSLRGRNRLGQVRRGSGALPALAQGSRPAARFSGCRWHTWISRKPRLWFRRPQAQVPTKAARASIEELRARMEPSLCGRHHGRTIAGARVQREGSGSRTWRIHSHPRANRRIARAGSFRGWAGRVHRRGRCAVQRLDLHRTARLVPLRCRQRESRAHRAVRNFSRDVRRR